MAPKAPKSSGLWFDCGSTQERWFSMDENRVSMRKRRVSITSRRERLSSHVDEFTTLDEEVCGVFGKKTDPWAATINERVFGSCWLLFFVVFWKGRGCTNAEKLDHGVMMCDCLDVMTLIDDGMKWWRIRSTFETGHMMVPRQLSVASCYFWWKRKLVNKTENCEEVILCVWQWQPAQKLVFIATTVFMWRICQCRRVYLNINSRTSKCEPSKTQCRSCHDHLISQANHLPNNYSQTSLSFLSALPVHASRLKSFNFSCHYCSMPIGELQHLLMLTSVKNLILPYRFSTSAITEHAELLKRRLPLLEIVVL